MILTVDSGEYELTVKKSRFIAVSRMIDGREDVKRLIAELRVKHPDARHVCYGFVADEKGDDFGYDDDGEPSGTAGKPIYSAIAASGAKKTAIAVVRYFGGIKLGAGGLTRAYRESAAELIASAGLVKAERRSIYALSAEGETFKKAIAFCRSGGYGVERIRFALSAECDVTVPCDGESVFASAMNALGAAIEKKDERYAFISGEQG